MATTWVRKRNGPAEPGIIRCDCGREVWLEDPLTNECDCGALYNMLGQALRPREQWEENRDEEPGVYGG